MATLPEDKKNVLSESYVKEEKTVDGIQIVCPFPADAAGKQGWISYDHRAPNGNVVERHIVPVSEWPDYSADKKF